MIEKAALFENLVLDQLPRQQYRGFLLPVQGSIGAYPANPLTISESSLYPSPAC